MRKIFGKDEQTKKHSSGLSNKTKKRLLSILASIVVFATAYSLILPAITIDQSSATEEKGFFLGEKSGTDAADHSEAANLIQTSTDTVGPAAEATETIAGEAIPDESAMPAQEFFSDPQWLKNYTVKVEAPEGALPEGAVMIIQPAADEKNNEDLSWLDIFAEGVQKQILDVTNPDGIPASDEALAAADQMIAGRQSAYQGQTVLRNMNGTCAAIRAFAIHFADANGNEIQPAKSIQVTLTCADIEKDQLFITAESKPEEITASEKNIVIFHPALVMQNGQEIYQAVPAKEAAIDVKKQELTFQTQDFETDPENDACPYFALVTTDTPVLTATESGEDSVKPSGNTDSAEPQTESETLNENENKLYAEGSGYSVSLYFTDEANIPADANINVKEVRQGSYQYKRYLSNAKEAVQNDEQGEEPSQNSDPAQKDSSAKTEEPDIPFARFYDITIVGPDGKEIEPSAPVRVEIAYDEDIETEEGASFKAVHFAKDDTEVISADLDENASQGATVSFEAESFSVYGIVYTVDFHYEVDGKTYNFSIPGGGFISFYDLVKTLEIAPDDANTEADETWELVKDVENIEFSNPDLVSVSKVEEDTTVGAIKDSLGLACEYSAELTEEQIAEINEQEAKAGDWALISLKPFDTEENITVTMGNGDQWTVKVTDAAVTSTSEIDEEKEYILYTYENGTYYVLKTDGSTVTTQNKADLDTMGHEFKWKFDYVYSEYRGIGIFQTEYPYYRVMPSGDNTRTIRLDSDTTFPWDNPNNNPLVAQGTFQMFIMPSGNGFKFEGYNTAKLLLEDGWFAGRTGNSSNYSDIVIYEPEQLSQFDFTVTSEDYLLGKVCGNNKENQYKEDAEYDTRTNNAKSNQYEIKAVPQTSRYMFDYWDLNGKPINNGATIPAGTLSIPYQGSKLTAHFKKDPNWQASDEEKEGRPIDKESFQKWLKELKERNIPLDNDGTTKTAELYDYENRIYRVDLTAKSNLSMFNGDIDLGFIIDVSGSMQFPSKLIPIAGKESVNVLHLNDNTTTKNSLDKSKEYYVIVDRTNRADVLRLKYCDGNNPAYPSHTGWPTGNPNSSNTQWLKGWGVVGLGYKTEAERNAAYRYLYSDNALFTGDNGPFQLYDAGDSGLKRQYYLENSIAGTISELNSILNSLAYANDSNEAADVKVAYNTFCATVGDKNHRFTPVSNGLSITYDYQGGTSTWLALDDARNFEWDDSATKVAVLITDGAPQESGTDGPTLDARVKTAADALKGEGVKLITVGLSMGDVKRGSRLLYDIATKDSDGDPYFYKAESGDELQYALYEVIQKVMADAIVVGNVTDTVNEAFYPVDKKTGTPLEVGNVIDLNGVKIADKERDLTTTQKKAGYGVIGKEGDNYNVTWNGQNFTWEGWHGTIYEKAKEDFLGGNAVRTNDPNHPAKIVPEGYKIKPEDSTITFKSKIKTEGTKTLETPRVNVNELDLTENKTEWTVYKGTKVEPKIQLEEFYDRILVKEVVTAAADVNRDSFPDRMTGTSMYYPLEESNSDDRERSGSGEQLTFKLKDLLKKLNDGKEITVDNLIEAGDEGITLNYNLYGQDCPGKIKVKLTKTGDTADYVPHSTTVTGEAVETYELLVDFLPDYDNLPVGQGGNGSKPYHTGTYSLAYPGAAAGEDYSVNTHKINVFAKKLEILKADQGGHAITSDPATFVLYRKATDDELADDSVTKAELSGLTGKYVTVQTLTTSGGSVTTDALPLLADNELYYLVETKAPTGYIMLTEPLKVTIDMTGHNTWTKLTDNSTSQTKPNPYVLSNWQQEATIKLLNLDNTPYDPTQKLSYDHKNDTTNASVTYKIINNAGYELPSTGGLGTNGLYLLGIILTALAGAGLVIKKRRKVS